MFLIVCLFIPIAISFSWVENFLTVFGIDQVTAAHAKTYLTLLLPSVLINSLGDSIDIFLISMGYTNVVCILQLVVIPMHLITCWAFVSRLGYGIAGAAMANNITAILTFACQIIYVNGLDSIKEAWSLPTRRSFQNLKPFIRLAMPGMVMLVI